MSHCDQSIISKELFAHISNHSKIQKNVEKYFGKLQNHQIKLMDTNIFLTAAKLCDFDLNRKYMSRASICKKNQLNRSFKTQVIAKTSLNSNLI